MDLYFHQGSFYKDLNDMQQAKKVGPEQGKFDERSWAGVSEGV